MVCHLGLLYTPSPSGLSVETAIQSNQNTNIAAPTRSKIQTSNSCLHCKCCLPSFKLHPIMHRWFHPNIGNLDAERLLLERGVDGSFLVRPSRSNAGQFSLSVRRGDKVTHIKIRHRGDSYDLHGGDQFGTLSELVHHYMENQLREKSGEVFELKAPLNSSDPTTERWFHGSISGADAEKMIRDKGVTGSFLVRESQSQVGGYVLTVRTKDEKSQNDKVTQVMIRYQNNKYDIGGGEKFNTLIDLVEHYKRNPMVETTGTVVNMKHPFNATRIIASDIEARVKELAKNNPDNDCKEGFWEEFEHLQHQECKVLFSREVGQEDRNLLKNRYKNILPFDHTRVILKKPQHNKNDDNEQKDDYINANFIKLVDDEITISPSSKPIPFSKIYIATQGPLPNTVNDFWWMIWQEKSECIVMMTNEIERGKNKCHRYWPTPEQETLICGDIKITAIPETTERTSNGRSSPDNDYLVRNFEIRYLGASENDRSWGPRRVVQYQYHGWPDQNIPSNPTSVLNFLEDINRQPRVGPMVVHCSAGIGRSGTLIVIDMLMEQLRHHGLSYEIDIQRIVKIVRAQRSGLVQTEAQYKFIYIALQSYISSLKHWAEVEQ